MEQLRPRFVGSMPVDAMFAGALMTLIILYIYYSYKESAAIQDLLSGFWEANREFCDEADLDMFCIFLSENYDYSHTRSCYVLAQKNGEFVINEPCEVQISAGWGAGGMKSVNELSIAFKGMRNAPDVFPAHQIMKFYPVCGKFVLYNGDTITAAMYKNAHRTDLNFIKNERRSGVDEAMCGGGPVKDEAMCDGGNIGLLEDAELL